MTGRLLWLAGGGALAAHGVTQPTCAPVQVVTQVLAESYGERPVADGLADSGQLVRLYRSEDGATWTLVLVSPIGVACLLISGRAWSDAAGEQGQPT